MGQIQGVAGRIRLRLRQLGYWKHDRPDVRRFCEERGYTTQYLYGWLRGRTPSFGYVTRLAEDLGVTVEWLALGKPVAREERAAPRHGRRAAPDPADPQPAPEPPAPRPLDAGQGQAGRGKVIEHPLARIGALMERLSKSEAELQSTVRAWRDSEERFRKIFEDGPLGMAVFDPRTLVFQGVNQRFAEMLGYPPDKLIGRHVLSYSHPDDTAHATASLGKVLTGHAPFVTREGRYIRKSGDLLWGHVTTIIIRSDAAGGLCGVKMIQDVTERRGAEERLQSLFDRVPVGLYRATPDGRLLDANPAYVQILGYPDRESLLATNVEVLYVDVEDRRRWRDRLERDGIARDFEKQLRRPDGTLIWVRDSARAVHNATGQVVAWEGALEDITARKRAEDTTRALAQIDRELAGTLDLARTTARIVTAVRELLHAHRSLLFELDRGGRSMVCVAAAGAGDPAEWIGRSVPAHAGISGLAIRHGEPRWSSDLLADPRVTRAAGARERGPLDSDGSGLGVPLTAGGEVLGALAVDDARGRVFTEEDLRLVSAFADQSALALRNARLSEEARQGRREAEVLADLTGTITASLDLDTVLQRIVDSARELCHSDQAQIARRGPTTTEVLVTHSSGVRYGHADDHPMEAGRGIGGLVLDTGRPFRTENRRADSRINQDSVAAGDGTIAEMVVPIRAGRGIEGLLSVSNRCHRPFTDRDEAILLRLADHVAVAIRNGRPVEEAERRC
jgi:PAS domain S-box-containing protein